MGSINEIDIPWTKIVVLGFYLSFMANQICFHLINPDDRYARY